MVLKRCRYFGVICFTGVLLLTTQLLYPGVPVIPSWTRKPKAIDATRTADNCACALKCNESSQGPIITIFTSIKDTIDRRERHNRMLRNWASLSQHVRSVLFVTGNEEYNWSTPARELGWTVRKVPNLIKGLPVLKDMFFDTFETFPDTPFYGFANSDNLFDSTLSETLSHLQSANHRNMFIVGRRTNVHERDIQGDMNDATYVKSLMKVGKLFKTNAQDYFITTSTGFPWHKVPDFVIGRPGYDNWLVAKSIEWNVITIDATDTLHDIHQTGGDGNKSGWNSTQDLCLNRDMAGEFDYHPGHTTCAPWFTARTLTGSIEAVSRSSIPAQCAKRPYVRRKGQPCV